jgi:molybdate transport system substrate-binding protein
VRRLAATVLVALLFAACGGGDGSAAAAGGGTGAGGTLRVFAAASLTDAFGELAADFERDHPGWTVAPSFAGSDVLAAQIHEGAPADVYAAASPRYPDELGAADLIEEPVDFATNRLVLIVPAANPAAIEAPADLRDGAKLVIGDPSVPVGAYTRDVLDRLGLPLEELNVVSEEQDVRAVLTKVELNEADAGFVYVTDRIAAGADVRQIDLPAAAEATATYPIAVVSASEQKGAAERWIELVTGERGQRVLADHGFGAAPSS